MYVVTDVIKIKAFYALKIFEVLNVLIVCLYTQISCLNMYYDADMKKKNYFS